MRGCIEREKAAGRVSTELGFGEQDWQDGVAHQAAARRRERAEDALPHECGRAYENV